jgi:hypothetical protein
MFQGLRPGAFKGLFQGLRPGAFKLWVQLDSTAVQPPPLLEPQPVGLPPAAAARRHAAVAVRVPRQVAAQVACEKQQI